MFSFAASLEGLTPEDLLASPTKLSNSLRMLFASFGVDGIAGWCDDTACAATLSCTLDWCTYPPVVVQAPPPEAVPDLGAIGVQGPTGVATEVLRRLGSLLPETVLVATMPGPVTLARHLSGTRASEETPAEVLERVRGAAKACLAYAKTLGDAGLDVLLVREEELLVPAEGVSAGDIARLYSSIWNTARFYGLTAMLALGEEVARDGDDAASAPWAHTTAALRALAPVVDGVVAPPPLLEECRDALKGFKRIGLALPADLPARPADVISAYLREYAVADQVRHGRLFLVTTEGEVPLDVDRAALIVGLETIRDHLKGEVANGA